MPVKRVVIGNKEKIIKEKEGTPKWQEIILKASVMTEAEVQAYIAEHFSTFKAKELEGIEMVFKMAWALANVISTEVEKLRVGKERVMRNLMRY